MGETVCIKFIVLITLELCGFFKQFVRASHLRFNVLKSSYNKTIYLFYDEMDWSSLERFI